MNKKIKVKDFLGKKYGNEDAILLREEIKNNLSEGVLLDFKGLDRVSTTFLTTLFNDLIVFFGRDYVFSKVNVKNISNYSDYSRVVLGTAFVA